MRLQGAIVAAIVVLFIAIVALQGATMAMLYSIRREADRSRRDRQLIEALERALAVERARNQS